MLTVGLTGGIGAGKSTASAQLARLGADVVDADRVAREVVAPGTPGLAAVVGEFGAEVLLPDGALDRAELGRRVFTDEAARRALNAIVHPLVAERTLELMAAAQERESDGRPALLVHDVPLLVENGLAPGYHLVLVVETPVAQRLARLAARGLTEDEARARVGAQATDAARRAVADVRLDGSGSPEQLAEQVQAVHADRLVPYARRLRAGRPAPRGPVALVEPDPGWEAAGARLVGRLRGACPGAVDVQHVGSTAVPDLLAKDVVDLQVEVADWPAVEALAAPLAAAGFVRREDVDGDPPRAEVDPDPEQWRKRMHLSADPGRPADVHVRVAGSAAARTAVALRELLRADPQARRQYASVEAALADRHPDDVDGGAEGESAVLVPLLVRALARSVLSHPGRSVAG